jgi:hypothetical protein
MNFPDETLVLMNLLKQDYNLLYLEDRIMGVYRDKCQKQLINGMLL